MQITPSHHCHLLLGLDGVRYVHSLLKLYSRCRLQSLDCLHPEFLACLLAVGPCSTPTLWSWVRSNRVRIIGCCYRCGGVWLRVWANRHHDWGYWPARLGMRKRSVYAGTVWTIEGPWIICSMRLFSSSWCRRMYSRINSSSRPSVNHTKYPLAPLIRVVRWHTPFITRFICLFSQLSSFDCISIQLRILSKKLSLCSLAHGASWTEVG